MSGFTNNLSNLPPGCSDADIERAQGGLDQHHFIECRIAELLDLGESWDETSARKEAEAEWELQQEEYRDALGAD